MNTINSTEEFADWVDCLADIKARAAIYLRIKRAERGNFGEYKVLDDGVSERRSTSVQAIASISREKGA